MMRKILLVACALFLVFTLGACSNNNTDEAVKQDRSLEIAVSSVVQTVDPVYVQSDSEIMLSRLVFSTLVDVEEGRIVADLAKSWLVSSDGLTYTFELTPGVLFHDGEELTAKDVKFSFERLLRLNAPTTYILANIKGASAVINGEAETASGIQVIDDNTLTITLKSAQSNFLNYLAMPAASILNRNEVVQQGDKFALPATEEQAYALPSGTGAFSLGEFRAGQTVSMVLFPDYFAPSYAIDRVELLQGVTTEDALVKLEAGEVDIVQDAIVSATDTPITGNIIEIRRPVRLLKYLAIKSDSSPYDQQAFRKALFAAASGHLLAQNVRSGYGICPADGLSSYWYDLSPDALSMAYDSEVAQAQLAESGHANGSGLPGLVLSCGPNQEDLELAQAIAESLQELGCSVTVRSMSYYELRKAVREGNVTFYIGSFVDKGSGLDVFYKEVVDSQNQGVIGRGSWADVLTKAYSSSGQAQIDLFSQAEQALLDQGVMMCLYYTVSDYAIDEQWSGVALDDSGLLNFEAYLEQ